jgi:hypothetical protein
MDELALRRLRAALRLLSPDDITPWGRRLLERVLDDEEKKARQPEEGTNHEQ